MEDTTKYYTDEIETKHSEDQCDKCLERVGRENLKDVPFLYLDKNDKHHADMSPIMTGMSGVYHEPGYRQYKICKDCKA